MRLSDAGDRLAIDFGTSNTVAVLRRGDAAPRTLYFDGSPLLPSGVFAGTGGFRRGMRDCHAADCRQP